MPAALLAPQPETQRLMPKTIKGRAVSQMVGRKLRAVEYWHQHRLASCGIFDVQSAARTGFSPILGFRFQ